MFLDDLTLTDYAVGTDMTVQHPTDTESILHINKQKYWNFDIDVVDKQFTYVDDEDSTLIENAGKVLEKAIDTDLLYTGAAEVQAGHIVPNGGSSAGCWNFAIGDDGTYVTITTAASWGIATLTGALEASPCISKESQCFPTGIVGRGFRLCSSNVNSPWYRITARTSSTVITFNNWDGSTTCDGISGSYLKGLQTTFGIFSLGPYYGCQIEGCKATAVTSSNIYQLVCEAAAKLDEEAVPSEDRHLIVPAWFKATLIQASQLQPDIAMYYTDTVQNGKVGRVAGFDIHVTADNRFSTCVAPMLSLGGDFIAAGFGTGTCILGAHKSFITFAHKWSESRVVDAQAQFAKLYQGLNLWGFKVLPLRRKSGVYIYGYKG